MDTSDLLQALQSVEKRAERVYEDQVVVDTYVAARGLVGALLATDNGLIAGRRGTGKTHALRYLAETERAKGNFVVFIDVDKDLGSTEGLYSDPALPLSERATRLLVDVLGIIHTRLLEDAFALGDDALLSTLEEVLDHFGEVVVAEQVETEQSQGTGRTSTEASSAGITVSSSPELHLGTSGSQSRTATATSRLRVTGPVRNRVHFGAVANLMARAIVQHPSKRCWFVFDEWSSLSLDIQPYLGEMLRRLFLGVPKVTTRIAVIPHRTEWRVAREGQTGYIGIEVGGRDLSTP